MLGFKGRAAVEEVLQEEVLNGQLEESALDVLREIRDLLMGGIPQPNVVEKEAKPKYEGTAEELRDFLEPYWLINNPDSAVPLQGCGVSYICTEREGDPEDAQICPVSQHNICYKSVMAHLGREEMKGQLERYEITPELVTGMSQQDRARLAGLLKIGSPLKMKKDELISTLVAALPQKPVGKKSQGTQKAAERIANTTAKTGTMKVQGQKVNTISKTETIPAPEKKLNAGALKAIELAEKKAAQADQKDGKSKSKKK